LLIKTINGQERSRDLETVKLAALNRPDIMIRDGYLSPAEKSALMAGCDCYVSLHRSEGFGLTMAEAMAFGKPVIATGYSGNTEFMTPENSYLCSYGYCRIGEGSEPYSAESRWADPNLEEAARFMREVYEAPEAANARGSQAADDIWRYHSAQVAGKAISDRIRAIRRRSKHGVQEPSMVISTER
jgi:glycosyltransferase involved in cell wall biosynthesis